ncbi:hypothetical protein OXX80_001169 [Metschnikowia pulcherrima]
MNTETPHTPKRAKPKLPRATLEQKIRILDHFHASGRPQSETVENFRHEVAISTSTFNEWLKHEDEYRSRYRGSESQFEKQSRRKVTYKYDKINRAMDLLVQQRLASGEEITEPILRNHWQIYAHQFGVENPKRLIGFSHGWLAQFKKRHGLSRSRQNRGDLTTSNNEKLLADPTSEEEAREPPVSIPETTSLEQDTTGHFQPQETLSFPQNITYLPDRSRSASRDNIGMPEEAAIPESAESLEQAMHLSLNTRKRFSAHDIERFLGVADRFFQDHQYDYPQTVNLYEEFKSSFTSERLINLRSSQEATQHMSDTLAARPRHTNRRAMTANAHANTVSPSIRGRPATVATSALLQQESHAGPNIHQNAPLFQDVQRKRHSQQLEPEAMAMHRMRSSSRSRQMGVTSAQNGSGEDVNLHHQHHSSTQNRHPHQSHVTSQIQHNTQAHQNHRGLGHRPQPVQNSQLSREYRSGEGAPMESREQMETLFMRQAEKERGFTTEEQWSNSDSRKLWEQNKLMLS